MVELRPRTLLVDARARAVRPVDLPVADDTDEVAADGIVGGAGEESRQTVRRAQESRKFVRGVIMLLNERAKVVSCAVMRSARAGEDRGRTEELGS